VGHVRDVVVSSSFCLERLTVFSFYLLVTSGCGPVI
jgi:hypothetical protein